MKAYFDKIYKGTYKEFVQKLSESLDKEKKEFIVTANPETFMIGDGNLAFDSILRAEHTTIVPDGIGVVKAANMLGIPLKDRITGVELCQDLFRLHSQEDPLGGSFIIFIDQKLLVGDPKGDQYNVRLLLGVQKESGYRKKET